MSSVLSRRGDVLVSETQRARMLSSAVQVISEHGYGEMSVARVTGRAGVSRRTFYDLFRDREDCFLAAFEETVARAREVVLAAYVGEVGWQAQVRAGLLALLLLLDREPGVRSLLVVDALKAGPRVQERRAEILGELSRELHEAGSRAGRVGGELHEAGSRAGRVRGELHEAGSRAGRVRGELPAPTAELPALIGEGVTGAVLGVIHTRLLSKRSCRMGMLLNPLMAVIVLPYLGPEAAQRELSHPTPKLARSRPHQVTRKGRPGDPLVGLPMRVTYRTLLVLGAIAERPGASNRQVADEAGVADQGQISKLLTRLEGLGLIENTGEAQPSGVPNAWHLTPRGRQVQQATRTQAGRSEVQPHNRGALPSAPEETIR